MNLQLNKLRNGKIAHSVRLDETKSDTPDEQNAEIDFLKKMAR